MSRFADLPADEKEVYVRETAARLNVAPQVVEKDFWVCWTLQLLFSRPQFAAHLVFEGGTSLSKVFKVIGRFSEDIDLSIGLPLLGYDEAFLAADASATRGPPGAPGFRFLPRASRVTGTRSTSSSSLTTCGSSTQHRLKHCRNTVCAFEEELPEIIRSDDGTVIAIKTVPLIQ